MKTISMAGSAVLGLVVALTACSVHGPEEASEDAERQQCAGNLKQIYQAIRAYQLEHRDLPAWFSDLVPQYLPDTNVFLCPTHQRTRMDGGYGVPDPKLRSSYFYEFCNAEVPGFGMAETGWKQGMTMKEWKMKQLLIYGAEVPLVRCWHHTPLLNVAFSGEVYESDQQWEAKREGPRILTQMLKTAGEDPRLLAEWGPSGSNPQQYEMGMDPVVRYAGQPAGRLYSKTNKIEGFGTYMQHFKADRFRGHRVRMNAQIKTEDVEQWAGLWMRVDGPEGEMLAFDNMQDRPIKDTVDWKPYSVVLDVPEGSQLISAGVLLAGPGKAWIADVQFDKVSRDVASTDLLSREGVEEIAQSTTQDQADEAGVPAPSDSPLARELSGVWILVGSPGKATDPPASGGRMKFISGGHWIVVQANPETGDLIHLHGGTCTFNGNEYVETKQYAAQSTYEFGPPARFKLSVEGDICTRIGLGNPSSEVWKRLNSSKAASGLGQDLFGTWKLISANYGGRAQPLPSLGTTLKHVTPTQFVWVSYGDDKKVHRSAGGSCTITGDTYEENAEYGIGGDFRVVKGKTHTFDWKVEGNKWHHTGRLASGLTIEEVWERVSWR